MKTLSKILSFIAILVVVSACDIVVVDPYDDRVNLTPGSYQVEEYSQTYEQHFQYSVWISHCGDGSHSVYIENFYNEGLLVKAEIIGRKIYVRRQYVEDYRVEGVGTITSHSIQMDYSVTDLYSNAPTDFCEATLYW
jgi:hypothetical protein